MPSKSKSQQRFMGMVHAAQKGDLKNPPKSIKDAAKGMKKKDAKDFASTKHKGLPEKVEKVEEGSFGFEETAAGDSYIDEVIGALMDATKMSSDNAERYYEKYYDTVYDCFHNENSADDCADKILTQAEDVDETVQNVVFNESNTRARFVNETIYNEDVFGKGYKSDTTTPKASEPEDNWPDPEEWTRQEGEKAEFDLRGMGGDWEEEDGRDIAMKHDGEVATVTSQATFTEVGDPDFEYYDIQFDDGEELYAVSGYHLFDV